MIKMERVIGFKDRRARWGARTRFVSVEVAEAFAIKDRTGICFVTVLRTRSLTRDRTLDQITTSYVNFIEKKATPVNTPSGKLRSLS